MTFKTTEQIEAKIRLRKLINQARRFVLIFLRNDGIVARREIEPYVLRRLSVRESRDGTIKHVRKPVHLLAFICGYKELEAEGEIEIARAVNVPFPMTDYESVFSLKEGVRT